MEHKTHPTSTSDDLKPTLTGATKDMKFPSDEAKVQQSKTSSLKGKTEAMSAELPSNEQVVQVLGHAEEALKHDDQSDPVVRHAAELVDAAKQLTIKKNKGEHLQKAFKASALAAQDVKAGTPEYEQLKSMRHSHLHTVPQLSRDIFYALLTDSEFRDNVSDLLEHIQVLFESKPDEELNIPEGYHVDSSKPIKESTAINPSADKVTTIKTQVVPIAKNVDPLMQQEEGVEGTTSEWKQPNYLPLSPAVQERMRVTWNNMLLRFAKEPKWAKLLQNIFELVDVVKSEHKQRSKRVKTGLSAESSAPISEMLKAENPSAAEAASEMKSFVANFVDDYTLASLIRRLHRLSRDIRTDAELRRWLGRLRSYINIVLRNPDRNLDSEKMRQRGLSLFNDGHKLLATSKFRTHITRLSRDWKHLIRQIGEDKELNAFTKALGKLKDDVTIAKPDGSLQMDFNAILEMRGVLLSVLLGMLREVTLPAFEGEQGHYKFKVSGMKLNVDDLLPSQITFLHETAGNIVIPQVDPSTGTIHTSKDPAHKTFQHGGRDEKIIKTADKPWLVGKLIVRAQNIVTTIKDCHFWYRHTTFPKTQDEGEATIDIFGRGMDIEIEFLIENDKSGNMFFTKGVVWIQMDKFKIHIDDAHHSTRYKLFKKAINKKVGDAVLNNLAQNIAVQLGTIASGFNQLIAKASPQKFASSFISTIDKISPSLPGMGGKQKDEDDDKQGQQRGFYETGGVH